MATLSMFVSDTCQPCKEMKPIVEKVTSDLGVELDVVSISTDEGREKALACGFRSVPSFMIGDAKKSGKMSESEFNQLIIRNL